MKSIRVRDFSEFVDATSEYEIFHEIVVFRGQPNQGALIPGISRKDPTNDTHATEKKLLQQLRLLGDSFIPRADIGDLDLLVLAQHFGLQTRLLDWSSNPLAALWFACADLSPGDVYVYALEADDLLVEGVYETDPFGVTKTRVFQPRLNNPRILAQHGWFTLHRYSESSKRFVSLEKNRETRPHLTEMRVPEANRRMMMNSLERHGVSFRTLFPDLNGLCRHLNWKYQLFPEE